MSPFFTGHKFIHEFLIRSLTCDICLRWKLKIFNSILNLVPALMQLLKLRSESVTAGIWILWTEERGLDVSQANYSTSILKVGCLTSSAHFSGSSELVPAPFLRTATVAINLQDKGVSQRRTSVATMPEGKHLVCVRPHVCTLQMDLNVFWQLVLPEVLGEKDGAEQLSDVTRLSAFQAVCVFVCFGVTRALEGQTATDLRTNLASAQSACKRGKRGQQGDILDAFLGTAGFWASRPSAVCLNAQQQKDMFVSCLNIHKIWQLDVREAERGWRRVAACWDLTCQAL